MDIQWFPGHMAKAKRNILAKLKLVDILWEVVDARLPLSSRNPMLDEIAPNHKRIILINKCDLADDKVTYLWEKFFLDNNLTVVLVNGQTGSGIRKLKFKSLEMMSADFARRANRGIVSQKVRAMILGIPNAGKSALINRLAARNAAATGDRPGITKQDQWIKIGHELELLDTPGILWPKFESQVIGMRLAVSGAIKSEILNIEDLALYLLDFLSEHYPGVLIQRYGVTNDEISAVDLLTAIGEKRGCIRRGGVIDFEKAAVLLLEDFKSGRLGKISLETPCFSDTIN